MRLLQLVLAITAIALSGCGGAGLQTTPDPIMGNGTSANAPVSGNPPVSSSSSKTQDSTDTDDSASDSDTTTTDVPETTGKASTTQMAQPKSQTESQTDSYASAALASNTRCGGGKYLRN